MDVPTLEQLKSMDAEEITRVEQQLKSDEDIDEIEVQQRWYRQIIDEFRGS
jgi:hypothetical protein